MHNDTILNELYNQLEYINNIKFLNEYSIDLINELNIKIDLRIAQLIDY